MKIAYFATSRLPSEAANAVQVMKMCEAFSQAGHEVVMYARTGQNKMTCEELLSLYSIKHAFKIRLIDSPDIWAIGGTLYGRKVFSDIASASFKPDLIYGRNLHALYACRNLGIKMIYETHAAPYNCFRQLLEDRLFNSKHFYRLVAINSALKNYYLDQHRVFAKERKQIIVAHDGADESFKTDLPEPLKFSAGYAGGLFPGKGFEQIIAIAQAIPEIEFKIAGSVNESQMKIVPENVSLSGRLAYRDVPVFLAGCSVLLAPYQKTVTTNDAGKGNIAEWMSPLKLFEYMAANRPIIASKLPAIEEILKDDHNALLVDPEDTQAWSQAIQKLRRHKDLRDRLKEQAYKDFSSFYTWKNRAAIVLKGIDKNSQTAGKIEAAGAAGRSGGRIRCLHIISDLDVGGSEKMLSNLVCASDKKRFEHVIISLLPPGALARHIKNNGIRIISLNMSRFCPSPAAVIKLAGLIKRLQPDVIHTWMYYADVIGTLAARLAATRARLIFSIRHGSFIADPLRIKVAARIAAMLANRFAAAIVCCSEEALKNHQMIGYSGEKAVCIPNGFVIPEKEAGRQQKENLCQKLGVPVSHLLIGMIGRFNPVKDHAGFLRAAGIVAGKFENVHFVLAGKNVDTANVELMKMISDQGLSGKIHLLGIVSDVNEILTGLNLFVSSSSVEAFANIIGEAMACGVACVATDVGASAQILGNTGIIVPPQNNEALASAICCMLERGSEELWAGGQRCHARIIKQFSLEKSVQKFENIYSEVIG